MDTSQPSTERENRLIAGRYELLEPIGSGGAGVVYRARDTTLRNEIVAVKLIHTFLQNDEALMRRLKNEVLITRRLASPHIVQVYDFGFAGGAPFVVMEFIEGRTLREMLSKRNKEENPVSDLLSVLKQLMKALAVAHAARVAHRDIKLENILFDRAQTLKLADFGIARLLETQRALGR